MTFQDVVTDFQTKNWYALAVLLVMGVTQLIKVLPQTSPFWKKIPDGAKLFVPVFLASGAAFVHGFNAHEPALQSLWDAVVIALGAMGGNAALTESPIPWNGLAGGKPATPAPAPAPAAAGDVHDRPTPVDPKPPAGDPPPDPPMAA